MFTMQPLFWASFPLILTATTTSGFFFWRAWLGSASSCPLSEMVVPLLRLGCIPNHASNESFLFIRRSLWIFGNTIFLILWHSIKVSEWVNEWVSDTSNMWSKNPPAGFIIKFQLDFVQDRARHNKIGHAIITTLDACCLPQTLYCWADWLRVSEWSPSWDQSAGRILHQTGSDGHCKFQPIPTRTDVPRCPKNSLPKLVCCLFIAGVHT